LPFDATGKQPIERLLHFESGRNANLHNSALAAIRNLPNAPKRNRAGTSAFKNCELSPKQQICFTWNKSLLCSAYPTLIDSPSFGTRPTNAPTSQKS
jgi:hypothetical protein